MCEFQFPFTHRFWWPFTHRFDDPLPTVDLESTNWLLIWIELWFAGSYRPHPLRWVIRSIPGYILWLESTIARLFYSWPTHTIFSQVNMYLHLLTHLSTEWTVAPHISLCYNWASTWVSSGYWKISFIDCPVFPQGATYVTRFVVKMCLKSFFQIYVYRLLWCLMNSSTKLHDVLLLIIKAKKVCVHKLRQWEIMFYLSTSWAKSTWPLPHAPASCVPSAVQDNLKIDPVDGFSKL